MRTPTAVLIGFAMVSLAIAFGPIARDFVISTASAQSLDSMDYRMLDSGLNKIANAIAQRCR